MVLVTVLLSSHFPKTWCGADSAEYWFKDIPIKESFIMLCPSHSSIRGSQDSVYSSENREPAETSSLIDSERVIAT